MSVTTHEPSGSGGHPQASIDSARAEAFAGRMLQVCNDAFLALMTSVGHQTQLFDTMAAMPPSTSGQVARAANLNERYVREWLGGMVAGGIVEFDAGSDTYRLPPEHAGVLTREAGPDNLASITQYVALLAEVEQPVIDCFRNGGGVPYSRYPRFQKLMAEDSGTIHDLKLISTILPLVPDLPERLRAGLDVLEIGCGQGHATNLMAQEFPASRFTAYDLSAEAIGIARAEARALGLGNVVFDAKDIATLGAREQYDFIVAFDVIHDLARPRQVLRAIHDALRPDGWFLMVDIHASSHVGRNLEHPLGPFLYAASLFHCMTVSLSQGGEGLGTVWGEEKARELLGEAGLDVVDVAHVPGDIINAYYVTRRKRAPR